jgi:2-desacetyl-2-hydroxyethyl bacteriochlorophyllide A dehydrogenase
VDSIRVGVMTSARNIEIVDVPKPQPGPGQVLVKIEACAICTTEQRIYGGVQPWKRFPYVGGHEAVGIVEAIGPDAATDLRVGDHVAIFSATCGYCNNCRQGRTNKCLHREGFWEHAGLWGTWGFAEYKVVKPRGLQFIHPDVSFEHGSLAEPLSCVVHGAGRSSLRLADEVVIIGAGTMGLLNAMVFKAMGALVTVLDLQESRCQKALKVGAGHAFVPDETATDRIRALTDGRGPALVVVASSSRAAYQLGQALLAPFGRLLAFAGMYPQGETSIDMTDLHRSETHLFGAVSSDIEDILIAGKIISNEMIDLDQVIECVVPFEQLSEAMERALQPDTYRVVLRM